MTLKQALTEYKLIAISRGVKAENILRTAEILLKSGIHCMEVTFDHTSPEGYENTLKCMDILRSLSSELFVGAGTVLSVKDVKNAEAHGALYIISPHTDAEVIRKTKEAGLVSIPGAMTPTECVSAVNAGADLVKLFPAAQLGLDYFKAIRAPLKHIEFVPTGGITPENIGAYLKAGAKAFGIGSNLINSTRINAGDFDSLAENAAAFIKAVQ